MTSIECLILSEADMRACLDDRAAVLEAVAEGVRAHAAGAAEAFPTLSMQAEGAGSGIYTIRGMVATAGLASVKTVGSFPRNRDAGLPPDPGVLTLIDTANGFPRLLAAASYLTTLRTAAMTALGAAHLARRGASVIGCIGARGIAPLAARLIAGALDAPRIRVHSRSVDACADTVAGMQADGLSAEVASDWDTCVAGADIVIDGAGLSSDAPLLRGGSLAEGVLVISYGAKCSFDDDVLPSMDRVIVDRWDPASTGALGRLIASGEMTADRIDAFFGDVVTGQAEGRTGDAERVLFWHRGLGACDIMLAERARSTAAARHLGMRVNFQ